MECSTIPAKVIATCFALAAFAAATTIGWAAGNSATTIIWRALAAMAVCYAAGRLAGGVAQRAVNQHIEAYKEAHPIPRDEAAAAKTAADAETSPDQQVSEAA